MNVSKNDDLIQKHPVAINKNKTNSINTTGMFKTLTGSKYGESHPLDTARVERHRILPQKQVV